MPIAPTDDDVVDVGMDVGGDEPIPEPGVVVEGDCVRMGANVALTERGPVCK